MVLFLSICSNRGARIGHQAYEHFLVVTYCKKYNINYVYYPFTCNSACFDKVLNFNLLHKYHYDNLDLSNFKIINLDTLISSFHDSMLNLNNDTSETLVIGDFYISEKLGTILLKYISLEDINLTNKEYKNFFNNKFTNIYDFEYICIHIRCGDIIDTCRALSDQYYIDRYNKLKEYIDITYPDDTNIKIIIVTEDNFKNDIIFKDNIKDVLIIKSDEFIALNILIHSKYLIASKSGFSNLAYILGNCKVVVPPHDWNNYFDNVIDIK